MCTCWINLRMQFHQPVCASFSYQPDTPCYYENTSNRQPSAYVLCERQEISEGHGADRVTLISGTQLDTDSDKLLWVDSDIWVSKPTGLKLEKPDKMSDTYGGLFAMTSPDL